MPFAVSTMYRAGPVGRRGWSVVGLLAGSVRRHWSESAFRRGKVKVDLTVLSFTFALSALTFVSLGLAQAFTFRDVGAEKSLPEMNG